MRKTPLFLLFLAASASAGADQRPSVLSVGAEGGTASGSLPGNDAGRLYGARIRLDLNTRWAVGGHFQSRTYKRESAPVEKSILQPVTAAAYYNLFEPGRWTPYAFAELGISHNRRTRFSLTRSNQKPAFGVGLGVELRLTDFHALALEAGHRRFAGASPAGHQVTETGAALAVRFQIPDDWIPIRPVTPLKIPDMDDPAARPSAPPLPDVEKRQAQLELDKIQQDIRDKKVPPIHFETGQAILLPASFETLDIVGTILRRYPQFSVLIAGHTDDVGPDEDNEILSLARAEVVRAYLLQNFGLPSEKLAAEGAGESRPIADNTTEEGRFLNRRVEFTIQP